MSDQVAGSRCPWTAVRDRVPGIRRLARLPRQLLRISPFDGDIRPTRVPLLAPWSGRPTLPFPHPWNYREPLRILETYFWGADAEAGPGRHTRYLDAPLFTPVLVTRDPRVIRAIATETGDKQGQFDRDTMPSVGIARATGRDTLLYANGPRWKTQKRLSTPPFGRTTLFQPEQMHEFEQTFRHTIRQRLDALDALLKRTGPTARVRLEPEIKAVMLELLVVNFFGAQISYDVIRERYVPALDRVIEFIVSDTVINRIGMPLRWLPRVSRRIAEAKAARARFEELTDIVIATRKEGRGLWSQFKSDAPDEALRSNIRVFLAGALEATTSYASWAISHLSHNLEAQDKLYNEVAAITHYTPETLENAPYLAQVLHETLRLTPALYFFPRLTTVDTWVVTLDGAKLFIPKGTHVLLDVWHANRHEDHWGVGVTGHPAAAFVPERWEHASKEMLHYGFGHGPRFCPGKHLGQLEVALVVGAIVKLFRFRAVEADNPARAGVSTKPIDGVHVDLELRQPAERRV